MSMLSNKLPKVSLSGASTYIIIFLGIIFLAIALGFFCWWLFKYLRYNKKVVLFRKVGKSISPVAKDKGWLTRVGNAGDTWFVLKKFKKTLPRPRIQMGKNTYWFYEREDGEWINFELNDLDEQMKKAGAYFVDEDMRLQRLGIQKNLADRFMKVTFWQKYGGMIMNILFLVIVSIMLIMLFREMKDNWAVGREMASAVRDMAKQVANMKRQVGSGMQEVVAPLLFPFFWRKK